MAGGERVSIVHRGRGRRRELIRFSARSFGHQIPIRFGGMRPRSAKADKTL
jgi:hypothetical protein